LDQEYWCSKEIEKLNVEILEDDVLQMNCQNLHLSRQESAFCSNAVDWKDRPCTSYFKRCTGNWPGQCGKISEISCRNTSDFVLPASKQKMDFLCKDNSSFVNVKQLCDGQFNCLDESDEALCQRCPPSSGYPDAATFSCRHRHTGRNMCAVPCDGKDDLCLDSSDEDCDKNSLQERRKPIHPRSNNSFPRNSTLIMALQLLHLLSVKYSSI